MQILLWGSCHLLPTQDAPGASPAQLCQQDSRTPSWICHPPCTKLSCWGKQDQGFTADSLLSAPSHISTCRHQTPLPFSGAQGGEGTFWDQQKSISKWSGCRRVRPEQNVANT